MTAEDERRAWVDRVLGVPLPAAVGVAKAPTANARPSDVQAIWRDAKDLIDADLEALRIAFLATGHRLAPAACEKGLGAFASNTLVRLQANLLDYQNSLPGQKSHVGGQLVKAVTAIEQSITSNPLLAILEDNPYRVPVKIRSVLRDAAAAIVQTVNDGAV